VQVWDQVTNHAAYLMNQTNLPPLAAQCINQRLASRRQISWTVCLFNAVWAM